MVRCKIKEKRGFHMVLEYNMGEHMSEEFHLRLW